MPDYRIAHATPPVVPTVPSPNPGVPSQPPPAVPPGWPGPGPGPGGTSPQRGSAGTESIEALGVSALPGEDSGFHCLTIIGQIEGHLVLPSQNKATKYEHLIPQLVAVEQNPRVEGLLVILNTVGGDVEAGLAIAELIVGLSKPSVSLVLGGGHSIGVPIAVSTTYSFIAPTATMTIHPIRLSGLVVGVPQTYDYLDKMQDRVIRFVVANSRIPEGRLRELLLRTTDLMRDIGTVLVGRDAVDCGLINATGGLHEAMDKLRALAAERRAAQAAAPSFPVPPPAAAVAEAPGPGTQGGAPS